MVLPSLFVVAAVFGGLASGGGVDAPTDVVQLVVRVNALKGAGEYASAAKLAVDSAADSQLDRSSRVLFGGLARENFELSYGAGGKVEDLCGQVAVMRMVAPLADDGGALQLATAAKVEVRLEQTQGARWRVVCGFEEDMAAEVGPSATTSVSPPLWVARPVPSLPPATVGRGSTDRRRVRAGVATLVPGVLLFAPVTGLLVYRELGEAEVQALQSGARGRPWTESERARGERLDERHRATTAVAGVLGATGAALVVMGVILAATGGRPSRMAVAPWGSLGAGGLVFQGRF